MPWTLTVGVLSWIPLGVSLLAILKNLKESKEFLEDSGYCLGWLFWGFEKLGFGNDFRN